MALEWIRALIITEWPEFLQQGGGEGAPSKTTFAPLKGACPLKFSKNNKQNNRSFGARTHEV